MPDGQPPAAPRGVSMPVLEYVSPTAAIIARPPPRLALWTVWLLALLFASLLMALALLPVDRVVVSTGRIIATSPIITLQPLETSIVRSVLVRPNQVVRAGEIIARLDPTFSDADLAALEAQGASLAAEVERLEAEAEERDYTGGPTPAAALQAAIFAQRAAERTFRIENYRQRLRSLEEARQRAEAELRQLTERQQVSSQIEGMRRELERVQIGSRLQSLIAADARLEIQRSMASAQGMALAASRDMDALVAERGAYLMNWRAQVAQDLAERRRALNDVRENINKARLRRQMVELRAPADAVVLELGKTSPGAVLSPGELLVSLVPLSSDLIIEADVPARDIGYVGVGDRVTVKLDSFPYVRHGTGRGTVLSLSEDSFRQDRETGARLALPIYRARISVDELHLRGLPPDFRLVPGMPVTADIIVGERTILRYFFERSAPVGLEGMREP